MCNIIILSKQMSATICRLVVLPDPFRGVGAQNNFAETQGLDQTVAWERFLDRGLKI